jgi:indole-3-acetate monooxygenase
LSVFPPPPIPLRQRPHARVALAKAEMEWRAARAFTYDVIDQLWNEVQSGNDVSTDGRLAMMQSLSFAFRTARHVTQEMYDLVGTTAVFSTKAPLDRLLRDAITMSQHLLLGDGFLEIVGGAMLGDPAPPLGIL